MIYLCKKCNSQLDIIVGKDIIYIHPCIKCLEMEYKDGQHNSSVERVWDDDDRYYEDDIFYQDNL